jgi:hypothetical protein
LAAAGERTSLAGRLFGRTASVAIMAAKSRGWKPYLSIVPVVQAIVMQRARTVETHARCGSQERPSWILSKPR